MWPTNYYGNIGNQYEIREKIVHIWTMQYKHKHYGITYSVKYIRGLLNGSYEFERYTGEKKLTNMEFYRMGSGQTNEHNIIDYSLFYDQS